MTSIALRLPLHGLRSQILHWAYAHSYPLYARCKGQPRPVWQIDKKTLLDYPPGSLGRSIGAFLQANELDFIPGFENHDVFHVLLNFGLTAPDEVALQWCLIGNGKRSVFSYTAAFAGSLFFPEHWGWFRQAFRHGRSLRRFYHWYFEYLLQENLAEMQAFLRGGAMRQETFNW